MVIQCQTLPRFMSNRTGSPSSTRSRHMHDGVNKGSQFLVSTHSPILLAFPDARILQMTDEGPVSKKYRETDQYQLTRDFLEDPDQFFRHLFEES